MIEGYFTYELQIISEFKLELYLQKRTGLTSDLIALFIRLLWQLCCKLNVNGYVTNVIQMAHSQETVI